MSLDNGIALLSPLAFKTATRVKVLIFCANSDQSMAARAEMDSPPASPSLGLSCCVGCFFVFLFLFFLKQGLSGFAYLVGR